VDFAAARAHMVDSQLRTNRVNDPVLLDAFAFVPRERFVPAAKRGVAYVDEDIATAAGRYLMEPMVLARLLQAAEVAPGDVVLDVGCGSGYAAAVLSRLAATVVAVESDAALRQQASETLADLGLDNAVVVEGPLTEGYPGQAPYNVILIEGAVGEVPERIAGQLADGGRLVTVVKAGTGLGRATLTQHLGGTLSSRTIFDAATPLLPGFEREVGFVF